MGEKQSLSLKSYLVLKDKNEFLIKSVCIAVNIHYYIDTVNIIVNC